MPTTDRPLSLPDVNVLVALTNASHLHHHEAHRWLAAIERFATTPLTESGLVRMLLNPAVVGRTVSSRAALEVLTGVRADPRARFLTDDSSLAEASVDTTGLAGHKQAADWHLLNLAARHDAVLVTFDRGIARAALPADAARIVTLT